VAFPCNQFLGQEPGTPADIKAFVAKYGVKFTMMEKINVNGPETHVVYRYLKSNSDREKIDWNFAKYLVSVGGNVRHFTSAVDPNQMVDDIEEAFGASL